MDKVVVDKTFGVKKKTGGTTLTAVEQIKQQQARAAKTKEDLERDKRKDAEQVKKRLPKCTSTLGRFPSASAPTQSSASSGNTADVTKSRRRIPTQTFGTGMNPLVKGLPQHRGVGLDCGSRRGGETSYPGGLDQAKVDSVVPARTGISRRQQFDPSASDPVQPAWTPWDRSMNLSVAIDDLSILGGSPRVAAAVRPGWRKGAG
ncbi:hypothetical protein A4X13_0g4896 [Tilletia indica]|uniref:Uncharacterized protein n=1 Tax=Tilletia indica TaxID=43049 RepID=A0A177TNG9_9BASI|nr:hypothetical protein A4X13_0g4896 [Tilletia indica]